MDANSDKGHDHKKLGKELDLFYFSDLVGSGLPSLDAQGHGPPQPSR